MIPASVVISFLIVKPLLGAILPNVPSGGFIVMPVGIIAVCPGAIVMSSSRLLSRS